MSKTCGDQMREALACNTVEQALTWLTEETERYVQEFKQRPEEARKIILSNLGYMAGYYDDATAKKIYRLFGARHPVFGSADYHSTVTPEQAFQKGIEQSQKVKGD